MRIALLCVDCEDCKIPMETLRNYPGKITTEQISAQEVKEGGLANFDTILLPGGAAKKYSKALGKVGAWHIQNFVNGGGKYIGICAGAYYACKRIQWRVNHPDVIDDKDTLGFINATARGPIRNFANNIEPIKGKIVHLSFYDRCVSSLYLGGPRFIIHPKEKVKVLAHYCEMDQRHNAAIIEKDVGLGQVTLISPHPEISTKQAQRYQKKKNCMGPLQESLAQLSKDERFYELNPQVFYDLILRATASHLTELC